MSKRNRKNTKRNSKNRKNTQPKAKLDRKTRAQRLPLSQQQTTIQQALALAVQHHMAGDLPSAKAIYQELLKSKPNQPDALNLLGVVAHQEGNYDTAVELLSRAITEKPDLEKAHSNLGITLKMLGRLEEAVVSYQKALAIKPDFPDALNNLGNALMELGRAEDAVGYFEKALAVKPNCVTANNLGKAFANLRRYEAAVASYRQAIAIKPDYVEALDNLGEALRALRRHEDAITVYRQAIAIQPDYVQAHSNLGNVFCDLGRTDEAIASHEKAIAIDPNYLGTLFRLACLYEQVNQLDKADIYVQKVLQIDPDRHDIAVLRAVLLRRRGDKQRALEILEALPLDELGSDQASRAYFELGKLYDRALDCERAYHCFAKGNQIQFEHRGSHVKPDRYRVMVEHTSRHLTPELAGSWRTETNASAIESPVFLVGFPRSGTTLLDQILDGHPRLQVMEEKPAINSLLSIIHETLGGYPTALASLPDAEICNLREQYYQNVEQHFRRIPDLILVDKFPLNLVHIPAIVRLFPTTRIILALRHPADVVLSNFMQQYRLNDAMANLHTIVGAARLYHRAMTVWLKSSRLFALNVHTIKYEDVVADLENEARKLIQFLELDWHDAVLDFQSHARQRAKINTPSYEQVIQPIYQRAKYRWKRYEEQLKPVLPHLQPFIEAFGYAEVKEHQRTSGPVVADLTNPVSSFPNHVSG